MHSKIYNLQTNIYTHYDHAASTKDNIKKGKTLVSIMVFCVVVWHREVNIIYGNDI